MCIQLMFNEVEVKIRSSFAGRVLAVGLPSDDPPLRRFALGMERASGDRSAGRSLHAPGHEKSRPGSPRAA